MEQVYYWAGFITVQLVGLLLALIVLMFLRECVYTAYQAVRLRAVQRRWSDPSKLTFYGPVQWVKLWWWLLWTTGQVQVHGVVVPIEPWKRIRARRWS